MRGKEIRHTHRVRSFAKLLQPLQIARSQIAYFLYSKISPGWQSNALQIASKVRNRMAFTLPFFNTEIFAIVIPTFSDSSVTLIFRFANMTSILMMIAMMVLLNS